MISRHDGVGQKWSLKAISAGLGAVVALVGLLVLVGWALDIAPLKSISPGFVSLKVNAAIAFVLCGSALALLYAPPERRAPLRLVQVMAVAVILIGGVTLGEFLLDANTGFDQFLFPDETPTQTATPGRMAPAAALNFVLFGLSVLLLTSRRDGRRLAAQWLSIVAGTIALLALIGYIYDRDTLYGTVPYTVMALHASLLFLLLNISVLLAHPSSGLMSIATSNSAGGILIRRLLPTLVGVPAVLGWLILAGERMGFYGAVFGITLFAILSVVVLTLLAASDAAALHQLDLNRRQADETVKAERDFASAVLDTAGSLIVVLDRQGRVVRFNNACEELTGYTAAEIEGTEFWKLLLPEERDEVMEVFGKLTAGQFPSTHRNYWVAKNGRRLLIDWSNTALLDREGQVQYVVSAGLDVTERMRFERMQAELIQAAASFAHQATPQMVLREAMERGLGVLEADTAALWQVNSQREELLLEAFHAPGEETVDLPKTVSYAGHQTAARSIVSGRAEVADYGVTDEGHLQPHDALAWQLGMRSILAVPLRSQRLGLWILTFGARQSRAFTAPEQRGAEILMEMAAVAHERASLIEDLRSAIRVREEFLNLAAHELKTPLTTLVGYTQLLLRQEGYSEETMRLFRTIKAQGDRVGRLGQSILDVSQIQSGDLGLRRSVFDLRELAEAAVRQMQSGTTRHQLSVEGPGAVFVEADHDRIQTVLLNLLDNAIKYSPLGGPVEVCVTSAGGEACVHVRDHGLGIPQEHQERLFQAFYQVAPMVSPTSGLGLGLYISREIVVRHGGRIWFETEPGKGSTFAFSLPLAANAEATELP